MADVEEGLVEDPEAFLRAIGIAEVDLGDLARSPYPSDPRLLRRAGSDPPGIVAGRIRAAGRAAGPPNSAASACRFGIEQVLEIGRAGAGHADDENRLLDLLSRISG